MRDWRFEPQIEPWLALLVRRRRHTDNINLRKMEHPRISLNDAGWRVWLTSPFLPVAGKFVSWLSLYRTR